MVSPLEMVTWMGLIDCLMLSNDGFERLKKWADVPESNICISFVGGPTVGGSW